ncbi:MAG: type 1 glutamine amidotransferase [Proteobacteria bacterium]|nr:type 1 glutamine amidotransferase [Pseudomonadota bacterium]
MTRPPTILLLNNTPRADARPEILDRFAGGDWHIEARWAAGGDMPEDISGYDAIYLSGSPQGAYDDVDWIHRQHGLIEDAAERDIPMFGVCFGSQIIASALCGRDQVFRRGVCEIGYLDLETSDAARRDPLCAELGGEVRMFVWHNDEVRHDHRDMVVLGRTPECPNQMWRHREVPAWGVQGHLEITRAEAPAWFSRNRARLENDGADVDALIAQADDATKAKTMLREFLRYAGRKASGSFAPGRADTHPGLAE